MLDVNYLPDEIAVFPLSNAIFFPRTILPLNIFEKRYLELVSDCMKDKRLFGMVQPKLKNKNVPKVYDVGCLGKIVSFNETNNNKFIIHLSGVIRFKIKEELKTNRLYRKFKVDYSEFVGDLNEIKDQGKHFENKNLINKVKIFFKRKNYLINFNELEKLNLDQMISTICMISPFSIEEKQKLVETIKTKDKINTLDEIINFHLVDSVDTKTIQ